MRNEPRLTILTISKATYQLFCSQLNDMLEDKVKIDCHSLEEGFKGKVSGDLVLTTDLVRDEISQYVNEGTDVFIANRALQLFSLDKLLKIPVGTRALLVCNSMKSARATKAFLHTVGINHIQYFPYAPEISERELPPVDLAITTGKRDFVPANLKIVDIQKRQLGISTIIQILLKFNLIDQKADLVIAKYVKRLVGFSKRLNNEIVEVNKANEMFQLVINHVTDGIIYINEAGKIKLMNKRAMEIFNIKIENIIDSDIKKEFFNINLENVLKNHGKIVNHIHKTEKKRNIITSIFPVFDRDENIGALAISRDITEIKELEETLRKELKNKGHIARYKFENIIGNSESLKMTKKKARNIASSNSTVLIQGETGTGKELFAQAIHNISKRKNGPFVAINCATIPKDLFESELFGYVEGAFTGALKAGKPGVFEQAHKGTIFLDEIGDIPANIQIKLLRVLEEREVMRVGSTQIIPIDIRIIAATNKDLEELVREGEFREDLFYRLNVLPLKIDPLRERKEDIIPLINYFLKIFKKENLEISPETMSKIYNYDWPGNIRQLRNCIECISQVCQKEVKVKDLPIYLQNNLGDSDKFKDDYGIEKDISRLGDKLLNLKKTDEYLFILECLYQAGKMNKNIGRRQIAQSAEEKNLGLSAQMVRSRIKKMEDMELVKIGRGRQGTSITEKGINIFEQIK